MVVLGWVIGLLVVAVLLARLLATAWLKPWVEPLDKLQSVLTVVGIVIAAVWYFFQRPQAAKLDIDQHVTAVSVDKAHAMLLIEVSAKNLGDTALNFRNSPYKIFVTQVTPLMETEFNEYVSELGRDRHLHGAEQWSPLASLVYDGASGAAGAKDNKLTSFVEAGETENLYFRVVLDCQPQLSVYVMSRFAKPDIWYEDWRGSLARRGIPIPAVHGDLGPKHETAAPKKDERLYWTKQSFVDLRKVCDGKALTSQSASNSEEK